MHIWHCLNVTCLSVTNAPSQIIFKTLLASAILSIFMHFVTTFQIEAGICWILLACIHEVNA